MLYRLGALAKQAGFKGLFAGLGPRMVMTAGLVSGQFLIYGQIKNGESLHLYNALSMTDVDAALGAPPGLEIHKERS